MKPIIPILASGVLAISLQAQDAQKLFESKCMACHVKTRPQDSI